MCGMTSATLATASCEASCQRHQRRLHVRRDVSNIRDGVMCGMTSATSGRLHVRHHVSDISGGFFWGMTSATSATASCAARRQRHQRRLHVRHGVSDISDGFMCGMTSASVSSCCRRRRHPSMIRRRPTRRTDGRRRRGTRASIGPLMNAMPCGLMSRRRRHARRPSAIYNIQGGLI